MAVKLGVAMGAKVVVLSRTASKQADAEKMGAGGFWLTTDADAMKAAAASMNFIIDTVSAERSLSSLIGLLGYPLPPLPGHIHCILLCLMWLQEPKAR
jgi:uncharacterized zinc-type alcohol dehydrogenase-like protein